MLKFHWITNVIRNGETASVKLSGFCYSTQGNEVELSLSLDNQPIKAEIFRSAELELVKQKGIRFFDAHAEIQVKIPTSQLSHLFLLQKDCQNGKYKKRTVLSFLQSWKNHYYWADRISNVPQYLKYHGFKVTFQHGILLLKQLFRTQTTVNSYQNLTPLSSDFIRELTPRVLIIAELSIPQCTFYRVEQKVQMLMNAGWLVETESWRDHLSCLARLQRASLVIFYRVPMLSEVAAEYQEAHRLGLKIGFEVDDLIFDLEEYSKNSNLKSKSLEEQKELMDGAALYLQALRCADFTIASTKTLSLYMKKYCSGPSYVIPNSILSTKENKKSTFSFPLGKKNEIIIGYGSGTTTHDRDFELCADAVLRIMHEYPNVSLAIHGPLLLPKEFDQFKHRIHQVGYVPFSEYSKLLSRFDINLAPLESTVFNDCKSNIKYLEASRSAIPTVASPCKEFKAVIQHAKNGFLAANTEIWYRSLKTLIESPKKRREIGEQARRFVLSQYDSSVIFQQDFKQMLKEQIPSKRNRKRKKILVVNVLYPPCSFGGATILTENLVEHYKKYVDPVVFCLTMNVQHYSGYLFRYEHRGTPVYTIELAVENSPERNYSNPMVGSAFSRILEDIQPTIVHFNSIQYLGVEMLLACQMHSIPYCVTIHDAWWICKRQFMLNEKQEFCHQDESGIDLYRCVECTHSTDLFFRWEKLLKFLMKSLVILAPSDYQRLLYCKSGIPEHLLQTNQNGIMLPNQVFPHMLCNPLTFAYIGGKCHHKGYFFLLETVRKLQGNFRLKLVDLNLKFNQKTIAESEWPDPSKIECCPPFDHHDLDVFYKDVDVLLWPSCLKESFGLSVREALSRNIWVIATDSGGDLSKDIHSGENGTIVPMYDMNRFAQAMQDLIDNPARLHHYENPYRSSIRSVSQQVDEIIRILKQRDVML